MTSEKQAVLYLVPTPIGNLKDITLRALEVLKAVDGIICEDTRHTGRLLQHYEIQKPLMSYHDHSAPGKAAEIAQRLEQGESLALVSDAGMPLISDPGFPLVREAVHRGIRVEALAGASALICALASSGLAVNQFSFLGFLSNKGAQRRKALDAVSEREDTLVFYESPFRIPQFLADALTVLGDREASVAREISKKFEETARGRLSALVKKFENETPRGEFVIVIAGHGQKPVLEAAS